MKKYFFLFLLSGIIFSSCEDLPTGTYVPQTIVEGVLYVDQPIRGIKIHISQPTTDTFRIEQSMVRNADVKIISEGQTYQLKYLDLDSTGEYFFPDTTILVKPNTFYQLEAVANGKKFFAETTTPGRISWTKEPKEVLQFPQRSELQGKFDSLVIFWNKASELNEYYISVNNLDTLGYGKYLSPKTTEKNSRVDIGIPVRDRFEHETARYAYLGAVNSIPPVWIAFKWYGMQEISVYAPDVNWLNWMKLTRLFGGGTYNENLGSMYEEKDGRRVKSFGVFGSVSVTRKQIFVLKPKS